MSILKANLINRFSFFAFLFISITFISAKVCQIQSEKRFIRESFALSWDNYGYYLHLPAFVIHHDIGIEDRSWLDTLNNKYESGRPFYQAWPGQKNRLVNVYPVGSAIFNLPFFLVGHLSAKIFGYDADSLSPPYQYAMIFSAIFYGILGFWFLRKLLIRYFSDKLSALIMLLLAFATNLFYYASYDCNLPHITLFAADTLILILTIKWHEQQKSKYAIAIGVLIGLITITRPSEIVWLFIPLFWGIQNLKTFREKMILLKRNFVQVLLLIVGMVAVGSLQLFYWKYTSGNWFSNNHVEGFDFFRPFTLQVLFSYKKGWLLYTPLMVFAILGLFLLYKKNKPLFFPFLIFFLSNLWFISSWECWWYGGTFGQRPFVESYGLMAIPLGYFLQTAFSKKILKYVTAFVLGFFLFLNQFQIWQLQVGILNSFLMTKDYYWKVFGKTKMDNKWRSLLEVDRGNLPPLDSIGTGYTHRTILFQDFENAVSTKDNLICDTLGSKSKKSQMLNDINIYAATLKKPYDSITNASYIRVRFYADVFLSPDFMNKQTLFVFSIYGHRNQSYCYSAIPIDSNMAKPNTWCRVHADYVTPYILHPDDKLLIFIWNAGGSKTLVDNVELVIYEPK